jgi:predicted cation transporter
MNRKDKINITIIACFSIVLGASLTPVGEPLSTVVVSKLNVSFWFLLQQLGVLIVPGILGLGIIGTFFAKKDLAEKDTERATESETYRTILVRTAKIFIFVIALELLGRGFKVMIDLYVIKLDSHILYWANIISAVLDNATLASAEISAKMSLIQIKSVLMGLLISGGMMIPGNIPNIISADKLKIRRQ